MPRLRAAIRELTAFLQLRAADVLICHGYKSNLLGRISARRAGVPIVSVSRGWTSETVKVQIYEKLDRLHLRFMDAIVGRGFRRPGEESPECRSAGGETHDYSKCSSPGCVSQSFAALS